MIISMFRDVIAITDRKLVKGDFLEQIRRVVDQRPCGLILREKDLTDEEYRALAVDILAVCREGQVPCFLHSRMGIAKELGCRRIHLPLGVLLEQENAAADFEEISISCHSQEDVAAAILHGATQIILGTIFETQCKKGLRGRGLDFVREICRNVRTYGDIPVYAIGGISPENLPAVKDAGARGGCMMSYMMHLTDVKNV